ncbi:MAG: hypothetical protein WC250_01535 [Candidatus Paceibacterota bacterium]|jgi:copper oxidase (laccase) domain-containing protein
MKPAPLWSKALHDRLVVSVFGRKIQDQIIDWNLEQLRKPIASNFRPMIARVCSSFAVRTFYAPNASKFNRRIARLNEFDTCFHVDSSNILRGTEVSGPVEKTPMVNGEADGIELPAWHSFMISSADCPTVILWSTETDKTVVFHAGRESVIDRVAIGQGFGTHLYQSVVRNALKSFQGERPKNLRFFITCGIAGRNFCHSVHEVTYGERNRSMIRYLTKHFGHEVFLGSPDLGCLDLELLIARQFRSFGKVEPTVPFHDGLDTFGDKDSSGDFALWSCRRAGNGPDSKKRNLVVVNRF